MIFSVADTFAKLKDHLKTVTRRPVKKNDKMEFDGVSLARVYREGRLLWEVGKTYAAQPGRGIEADGRIKIISLEVDPNPGYMTMDEARKEGFEHPNEFKEVWVEMYGDVALWRPAFRIEFEYIESDSARDGDGTKEAEPMSDEEMANLFSDPTPPTDSEAEKPPEVS